MALAATCCWAANTTEIFVLDKYGLAYTSTR